MNRIIQSIHTSIFSTLLANPMTFIPLSAKVKAVIDPIDPLAPVTTTTLPFHLHSAASALKIINNMINLTIMVMVYLVLGSTMTIYEDRDRRRHFYTVPVLLSWCV